MIRLLSLLSVLPALLLGCTQAAKAPETSAPAPAAEETESEPDGGVTLPGHGDVIAGGDIAAEVAAALGLADDAIDYIDGSDDGRLEVFGVKTKGLEEAVLKEVRAAREKRDMKPLHVVFYADREHKDQALREVTLPEEP